MTVERRLWFLIVVLALWPAASARAEIAQTTFETSVGAEAIATVSATCDLCAWDVAGREAVVLSLALDGHYSQHLTVVRSGRAEYRVMLGRVEPGRHTLAVEEDSGLTASELRGRARVSVGSISITLIDANARDYTALSLAPILYARADTVGRFTDVPVLMWYEIEPTSRGTRYRYSVIFTNEDGGTPADRLMATWGRTTDIEYVYAVEIDQRGAILTDDIQGPKHEILTFSGRRDGRHPLLWVSTSNNMVLPEGTTQVRYAPAPVAVDLRHVSREAVMDTHPWLYDVMTRELKREGKIAMNPPPGQGTIRDPRAFLFVEACGEVAEKALAFAFRVGGEWISTDRGLAEFRIVRDGCFRAAAPLPPRATIKDVAAIRAEVFARTGKANTAPAHVTRINAVFTLDELFVPTTPILTWSGDAQLQPGGRPLEVPIP